MKTQRLLLIAAAVAFVSCNTGKYSPDPEPAAFLKIADVGIAGNSKAVLEGTSFPDENPFSIGIFLDAKSGGAYPGGPYHNIKVTKPAGSTVWSTAAPVALSATAGRLCAYYPYDASVSDVTAIPVHSSLNGSDYLFAVPVEDVNASNPEVPVEMKHALALVCMNFKKGESYQRECKLSSISLQGDGIAASGTLDATDGTITAEAAEFVASGFEHSFSSPLSEKLLVIPAVVSSQKQTVKIVCTIDGDSKTVTFQSGNGLIVKQGVKFTVDITVNGNGLGINGISITDWNGNTVVESGLVKDGLVITGAESGEYGGKIEF